jgi:DNA-binding NtrC family response regulator
MKVAVLDDSEVMCSILKEIVSFMGFEVATFERVAPFIQSVRREIPDYLIIDAILQEDEDTNGLEVIEQVRQLPGLEASHYILLTANPAMFPPRERLHERQIELLTKPCSLEDLEMALV